MTRGEHGRISLVIALCAGCSLPSATFTPDPGGDAAIDAPAGPVIEVSTASLQTHEGMPIAVEVRLGQPPADDTTVAVVSGDPALGVLPAALTFSTTNWSTFRPVTVTAADDIDAIHLVSSLSFSAPGYADASMAVVVEDNDLLNVPISVGICADEGPVMAVAVKLHSAPLATTTVSISESSTVLDLAPSLMMFTPSNFDTPQLIELTPLESGGGGAMITVSAAGQATRSINVNVGASGSGCK